MSAWRAAGALATALLLSACELINPASRAAPGDDGPTKGLEVGPGVRDSVYLPVDRASVPPPGYALYTVLLARKSDKVTLRMLSELFASTDGAGESALPRQNLNLIMLPVKKVGEAARLLSTARSQPDVTAATLMQKDYDFGQAALLMASLCQPMRGADVVKACGSQIPEGPLLVTSLKPLGELTAAPGERLLVVNLSRTQPDAAREVLAAYRRQILRAEFTHPVPLDWWRLWVLNHLLDAANLLPEIRKAYTATA